MHIAVYAITDLRSLRSVIKTLRKINKHLEVLEIPDEVEDRIYHEIGRIDRKAVEGVRIVYDNKTDSFFTVDGCRIKSLPYQPPKR